MSVNESSVTVIPFKLDLKDQSDLTLIAVCSDPNELRGLITNTRSWLGKHFLNCDHPEDPELRDLLGLDFNLVTLEFVYPVEANATSDVIVQVIVGTNVITVRTVAPSPLVPPDKINISEPVSVTLYSTEKDNEPGIAYCHHHFDSNLTAGEVFDGVANIILFPLSHMERMNKDLEKTVQHVHKSGKATTAPSSTIPVNFGIKQHNGTVGSAPESSTSELRFIFQRHLDRNNALPFDAELLPCVKPSGTYTMPDKTVIVAVDTITFVDYAPTPPPGAASDRQGNEQENRSAGDKQAGK